MNLKVFQHRGTGTAGAVVGVDVDRLVSAVYRYALCGVDMRDEWLWCGVVRFSHGHGAGGSSHDVVHSCSAQLVGVPGQ